MFKKIDRYSKKTQAQNSFDTTLEISSRKEGIPRNALGSRSSSRILIVAN